MKRGTPDHPKMFQLARKLGVPRAHAVGMMEVLWHWVARFAPAGDIGKWDDAEIAAACDWRDAPEDFTDALVSAGWIDRSDEFRLIVHDWPEHCEDSIHTSLARSGKLFADGSMPSTSRLNANEKVKAEEALSGAYNSTREKARKSAQTREKAPCLSQASAKPEPSSSAAGAATCDADPPPIEPEVLPEEQGDGWQALIEVVDEAGMRYSQPDLSAVRKQWGTMPIQEQLTVIRHIRDSLDAGMFADEQYVPALKNFFRDKRWQRGVRERAGPKTDDRNLRALKLMVMQREREAG